MPWSVESVDDLINQSINAAHPQYLAARPSPNPSPSLLTSFAKAGTLNASTHNAAYVSSRPSLGMPDDA